MKLKHFASIRAVMSYIGSELTATLTDDMTNGDHSASDKRTLRNKITDIEVVMPNLYHLDDAEHATVLAALRYYQQNGLGDPANRQEEIHIIATNGDTVISLDAKAIDALCERLNTGG